MTTNQNLKGTVKRREVVQFALEALETVQDFGLNVVVEGLAQVEEAQEAHIALSINFPLHPFKLLLLPILALERQVHDLNLIKPHKVI
jgi:hypothetical protein